MIRKEEQYVEYNRKEEEKTGRIFCKLIKRK